jgi:hypothetical protein
VVVTDKETDGVFEETKEQVARVNGIVVKRIMVTIPAGKSYAFKVAAKMKDGTVSEFSNRLVVTAPSLPPAPTNIKAEIVR